MRLGLDVTLRPKLPYRCVLASQWPSSFSGNIILALGLVLIARGNGLQYIGVPLLAVIAYGIWRSLRVAISVDDTVFTVINPVRSYRIEVDQSTGFRPASLGGIFPYADGIEIVVRNQAREILATGALTREDQERLVTALTRLAQVTGCRNDVSVEFSLVAAPHCSSSGATVGAK